MTTEARYSFLAGTGSQKAAYYSLDTTSLEVNLSLETDVRGNGVYKTVNKFFGGHDSVLFEGEDEDIVRLLTEVAEDWVTGVVERMTESNIVYCHHTIKEDPHDGTSIRSVAVHVYTPKVSPLPDKEITVAGRKYILQEEPCPLTGTYTEDVLYAYARLTVKLNQYVIVAVHPKQLEE